MRRTAIEVMGSEAIVRVSVAGNPWARFRGLFGRRSLPDDEGLLLSQCTSVHTCFMAFAIDVVYLDRAFAVTRIDRSVRPWRVSFGGRGARHALELSAGAADRIGLVVGDRPLRRCSSPGART